MLVVGKTRNALAAGFGKNGKVGLEEKKRCTVSIGSETMVAEEVSNDKQVQVSWRRGEAEAE